MGFLKNHRSIILLSIVFIVGVVLIVGSAFYFGDWWKEGNGEWSGSATRNLIIALGAWGGLWGLILGAMRLNTFSKQVEVGQKQVEVGQKQAETSEKNLFNDRLSRAIEAIGKKDNLTERNAGLRLIDSLLKGYDFGSENHTLLLHILHDYIRDRAIMPEKDEKEDLPDAPPRETRTDIELAIQTLFAHVPKEKRINYPLDRLDLRKLDFSKSRL